jgi:hypothetical protein
MAPDPDKIDQIEGQWDELIQHPDWFAGRRVRVTVLSGEEGGPVFLQAKIRDWLAEGESLSVARPVHPTPSAFEEELLEKYRKQGLVL